jgi:hemoglobin-like flavoprotein
LQATLLVAKKTCIMTDTEICLVKKTWKIVAKLDPVLVGDVFYSKLFLESPEFRSMFTTNGAEQSKKLILMLTTVVCGLDRLDELKHEIYQLGIRHKNYGVQNWHYEKVGAALIWTLEHALGSDFSKETKAAWIQCYTELSAAMIGDV